MNQLEMIKRANVDEIQEIEKNNNCSTILRKKKPKTKNKQVIIWIK